jgi:hypothetical protein
MQQAIYLRQLDIVLQGEVFGEYAYAIAAKHSRDAQQVLRWRVLHELELQTKHHVAEVIRQNGGVVRECYFSCILGVIVGWLLCWLPWWLVMNSLRLLTRGTVLFYERLEREVECDLDLFQALKAHEWAQWEFAVCELAGQHTKSLEVVLSVLKESRFLPQS